MKSASSRSSIKVQARSTRSSPAVVLSDLADFPHIAVEDSNGGFIPMEQTALSTHPQLAQQMAANTSMSQVYGAPVMVDSTSMESRKPQSLQALVI